MPNARDHVEALVALDSKEEVDLTLDDGTLIEARISQVDYTPDERLRLELSLRGENARYQARARFDDGDWTQVEVRRYSTESGSPDWVALGVVADVTPS